MAASSLLTLIDDIATLLDDVAVMTKVAARKTAGVLGDDLALNAQQVTGVSADRELPVVWAVAKGSALNKLILVPTALAISALAPWAITPLLMLGGAFLCYEGFEKLAHKFLRAKEDDETHHRELVAAVADPQVDMVQFEGDKVKGAIRTDFILSAEIIVITLGTVAGATFGKQVAVLSAIALIMTIGVYGFVAGIVKLDDAGVWLVSREGRASKALGRGIIAFAPWLMKGLSIMGTAAMFLVGGSILVHGLPGMEGFIRALAETAGKTVGMLLKTLADGVVGVVAGGIVLALITGYRKVRGARQPAASSHHET